MELFDQWPPLTQPRTLGHFPLCKHMLSPDWGALSSSFPADSICESHFEARG